MKKFTNIIGYLAAFAIVTAAVFKLNHMPGAGMVLVINMLLLSIYFPVYIIDRMRDSSDRKILPLHVVAALCTFIIILAILFKFQHWKFAGSLITLGLGSFSLIFVPMLIIHKSKQEGSNIVMNVVGAIGLAVFALGILFKLMHWAGAGYLLIGCPVLLFLIYFPMYMMSSAIPDEKKSGYLRNTFFGIIIGCIIIMFVYLIVYMHAVPTPTPPDSTITPPDSTMQVK